MLLQLGEDTPESDAAASVLAQLASKPAFYQLRTVEQLGYVVCAQSGPLELLAPEVRV